MSANQGQKKQILILLIAIAILSSCTSTVLINPSSVFEENYRVSGLNLDIGDPNLQTYLDQASQEMLAQNWVGALEALKKAEEIASIENSTNYFQSLMKRIVLNFFGSEEAVAFGDFLPKDRLELFSELTPYLDKPMQLIWEEDQFALPSKIVKELEGAASEYTNYAFVEIEIGGQELVMLLDTGFTNSAIFHDSYSSIEDQAEILDTQGDIVDPLGIELNTNLIRVSDYRLGSLIVQDDVWSVIERKDNILLGVDGVIGWSLISQLVYEWNQREGRLSFYRSYEETDTINNFVWMEIPLVLVIGGEPNQAQFFFLDTGASRTSFAASSRAAFGISIQGYGSDQWHTISGINTLKTVIYDAKGVYIDRTQFDFLYYDSNIEDHSCPK
jgi:hypothetical protein